MGDDSGGTNHEFEQAGYRLAREILAHDFSKREGAILSAILELSYFRGLNPTTEGVAFGYADLGRVARVSKGNAHAVLKGLERKLVVVLRANGFGVRLPFEHWKVALRTDREAARERLPISFATEDLQDGLRESFVEAQRVVLPTRVAGSDVRPVRSSPASDAMPGARGVSSSESAGSRTSGGSKPVSVAREGYPPAPLPASMVPKSGTSQGGFQIGNRTEREAEKADLAVALAVVPNSGTASRLQGCNLGTKQGSQGSKVSSLQPCRLERSAALSGEQQDAFDDMEALGFWGNDPSAKWNWLKRVRTVHLDKIKELIGEVRYTMHQRKVYAPGAYANVLGRQWGLW